MVYRKPGHQRSDAAQVAASVLLVVGFIGCLVLVLPIVAKIQEVYLAPLVNLTEAN